jgi:hypothetical protein
VLKKRIVLQSRNKTLSVLVEGPSKTLSFQSFSIHETPRESLVARLKEFRAQGASEAVLIMPREELLSQEFEVMAGESAQKTLSNRLEKSFPYKIEELAYGLRVTEEAGGRVRGTVMATPSAKLETWIMPLEEAGFILSDVLSSDEALAGFFESKVTAARRVLLLDLSGGALECVLIADGKILFSKVMDASSRDLAREIGLLTVEFENFEKICVCGADAAFEALLRGQFQVPVEKIETPRDSKDRSVPCALYAALLPGKKMLSLLPVERKKQKRDAQKRKSLLGAIAAFLLLAGLLSILFAVHIKTLDIKAERLTQKAAALESEMTGLREMNETLCLADGRYAENRATLALFKGVSLKMPQGITITSLRLGRKVLLIAGDGQDNACIADSLTTLKSIEGVTNVRLEYARLKEAPVDGAQFEFLITAERA